MNKKERAVLDSQMVELKNSVLGNLHALGFSDAKLSDIEFHNFAIASRALGEWGGDMDLEYYQDRNVAIFKVHLPSIPGLTLTCEMNSMVGAPSPYKTYYIKRSIFKTKCYLVDGPKSLLKIEFTKRDSRKFAKLRQLESSKA